MSGQHYRCQNFFACVVGIALMIDICNSIYMMYQVGCPNNFIDLVFWGYGPLQAFSILFFLCTKPNSIFTKTVISVVLLTTNMVALAIACYYHIGIWVCGLSSLCAMIVSFLFLIDDIKRTRLIHNGDNGSSSHASIFIKDYQPLSQSSFTFCKTRELIAINLKSIKHHRRNNDGLTNHGIYDLRHYLSSHEYVFHPDELKKYKDELFEIYDIYEDELYAFVECVARLTLDKHKCR